MLYTIDSKNNIRQIVTIPYQNEYTHWRRNLSNSDYNAIMSELANKISGSQIQTSSWMPGDWNGSVYMAIYEACDHDESHSGLFFGLLVWEAFMNDNDPWSFGHYSLNNVPIRGLTYYRIHI